MGTDYAIRADMAVIVDMCVIFNSAAGRHGDVGPDTGTCADDGAFRDGSCGMYARRQIIAVIEQL